MTEKEKMLAEMLYDANNDKNLIKERLLCKDICYEYNNLKPSAIEAQKSLIKKLLGKTKNNFSILAPFWCDYGYNIEIGENFFANHNVKLSKIMNIWNRIWVFIFKHKKSSPLSQHPTILQM